MHISIFAYKMEWHSGLAKKKRNDVSQSLKSTILNSFKNSGNRFERCHKEKNRDFILTFYCTISLFLAHCNFEKL